MCERDPESVAHAREIANWGKFEVVVSREGEEIGTLDKTFSNDYDAHVAARQNEIPDVGIETTVREVST